MTTPTSFISATPIIDVGLPGKEITVLPLYSVKIYDGPRVTASLLINYTFSTDGIFESDLGHLKLRVLESLRPYHPPKVVKIEGSSITGMAEQILRVIRLSTTVDRVLFTWERQYHDDAPFYAAIGFASGSSVPLPVSLSSLGLSISSPFVSVYSSLQEMKKLKS